MIETEKLVDTVVKGLQEKKGHSITTADLRQIGDTICRFFVLCTGNSPSHVQSLAQSVDEMVRKEGGTHPAAVAGMQHAGWVAMDYGDVMVHIFLGEEREFYDLEHLWADAVLEDIPDLL